MSLYLRGAISIGWMGDNIFYVGVHHQNFFMLRTRNSISYPFFWISKFNFFFDNEIEFQLPNRFPEIEFQLPNGLVEIDVQYQRMVDSS